MSNNTNEKTENMVMPIVEWVESVRRDAKTYYDKVSEFRWDVFAHPETSTFAWYSAFNDRCTDVINSFMEISEVTGRLLKELNLAVEEVEEATGRPLHLHNSDSDLDDSDLD